MVCAIGLFIVGYYWGNQHKYSGGPPAIEGVLIAPTMALPPFALMDAVGQPFDANALNDRWTLLAFGEVSQARGQLAVARMIDIYNRLVDHADMRAHLQLALAAPVQSLNLARDFSRLSPALRVVSGEAAELARLTTVLGDESDGRGIGQAVLYLTTPNGDLLALFAASQSTETIVEDLIALYDWPLETLTTVPDE